MSYPTLSDEPRHATPDRADVILRGKSWDLCCVIGCRRPTQSGEKEKESRERFCVLHHPKGRVQETAQEFKRRYANHERNPKARKKMFVGELSCVFKPYQRVKDRLTKEDRYVFITDRLCGAPAPRKKRKLLEPMYPNRFGEPLCEKHKIHRDDRIAFPSNESELAAELLASNMRGTAPPIDAGNK